MPPLSHYTYGRNAEYRAKRELEADGWTVIRSSGSHGPHDILAFKADQPVRCIQVKATKSEATASRLIRQFTPTNHGHYRTELWVWYNRAWSKKVI